MRYYTLFFVFLISGSFLFLKKDFQTSADKEFSATSDLNFYNYCSQDIPKLNQEDLSKICISKSLKDFGSVGLDNKNLKHSFEVFNKGNAPLVIYNVRGNGGHMPSKFPKESIPVGGKGIIETTFSTKGKRGTISSRWMITANTIPSESYLNIRADLGYCSDAPQEPSKDTRAQVCIPKTTHNFDTIAPDIIRHQFEIFNNGNIPLIVKSVKGSGGHSKWPKEPIPVGEKATIEITWNAKGKRGKAQSNWTIHSNTFPEKIYLKAYAYFLEVEKE